MTTDEKFRECFDLMPEWVDAGFLGYPCGIRDCRCNFNGMATCYNDDRCFKKLYHELTDAKKKYIEEDEDGNSKVVDNEWAFGAPFECLEPWVRVEDLPKWERENGAAVTRVRFVAA